MSQETINKISKEMTIADILNVDPSKTKLISEILIDFGIHCVGCHANAFETLEEGVLGHGYSENELNTLVENLNKLLSGEKVETINKETKVPSNFSVKLTTNALNKVKEIMKKEGKENEILRASVLSGGCSGYTYDLEVVPNAEKSDIKLKQEDVNIAIERDSTEFLNGTEIDFIDTLNESGFKFNNPNSSKECGCGKSFS
jgi:iron-sulfur cluster assembly accessory protein